jgi:hypothetical protein
VASLIGTGWPRQQEAALRTLDGGVADDALAIPSSRPGAGRYMQKYIGL